MVLNAIEGRPLPIYGDGGNVRDWLHVEDHCAGLLLVLGRGRPGGKYNIGGANERTNLEVVDRLCDLLDSCARRRRIPRSAALPAIATSRRSCRIGRDMIVATPSTRRRSDDELGWEPRHNFEDGLRETVAWYLDHRHWCEQVQAGRYNRERLGLRA